MERWKPIKNYEGLYEVSDHGNVRSVPHVTNGRANSYMTFTGKLLKPQLKRNGYLQVALSKNGHKTWVCIHRLVAESFIPNQDELAQINHIDGNKKNNVVNNLEWITPSENMKHAYDTGLLTHYTKLTPELVEEIRNLHKPYDKEYGTKPLAIKYGVGETTIRDIVHGRRW